ncbi:MAG: M23 family metallopeptidase [Candidatus Zixiibacteriota bacterium]
MFDRRLTFIVVPDSSNLSRQLSVRVWYLWAGLAGVAVLLLLSSLLASAYLTGEVDQAELERLRAENKVLADKYTQLRADLEKTDARYNELVQKEIAIRTAFGLPEINVEERQLGVGGPLVHLAPMIDETTRLAVVSEAEIDRLLRLSSFELEKYAELEAGLEDIKDRLDHTPSIWPVRGWLSRGYGMRPDPFTGYRRLHRGVDISSNTGTPIIAPAAGRVKAVVVDRALGKLIEIDHGYGFVTRYGHLSAFDVQRGQLVERGETIGRVGSTGYSTGPHLHYEVWRNGKVLNPHDYIINDM